VKHILIYYRLYTVYTSLHAPLRRLCASNTLIPDCGPRVANHRVDRLYFPVFRGNVSAEYFAAAGYKAWTLSTYTETLPQAPRLLSRRAARFWPGAPPRLRPPRENIRMR